MEDVVGSLPGFLIIGAMRSGTSALNSCLTSHPEIFTPSRKELHFFDRHFDEGLDWYRQFFSDARDRQVSGEATPAYLGDFHAPDRIGAVLPDAKLIAILRNPIDRAYSHYWMNRARAVENRAFHEAVKDEFSGRSLQLPETHLFDYVNRGRYLIHLSRFPQNRPLVFLFDDLCHTPVDVYQEMCRFLEVDDSYVPPGLGKRVNQFARYRSIGIRRLSKRLPSGIRKGIARLNTRPESYPPLDDATRRVLGDVYREDNARLAEWLQRDLSIWQ